MVSHQSRHPLPLISRSTFKIERRLVSLSKYIRFHRGGLVIASDQVSKARPSPLTWMSLWMVPHLCSSPCILPSVLRVLCLRRASNRLIWFILVMAATLQSTNATINLVLSAILRPVTIAFIPKKLLHILSLPHQLLHTIFASSWTLINQMAQFTINPLIRRCLIPRTPLKVM